MSFDQERLTEIQDKGILAAAHIYNRMILDWIRDIKFRDTYGEAKALIPALRFDDRVSGLLRNAMMVAYLQGRFRANQEIAYQVEKGKLLKFAEQSGNGIPLVHFFASKIGNFDFAHSSYNEAIEWLRSKVVVSPEEFKALDSSIKQICFSVQGIEQKKLLQALRDSLDGAMLDGQTYRQWAKNVDQTFSAYGVTPLSPHHLETVFRTNLQSVYHIAKWENFEQDDNVTGYEYIAVMDDRTRDEHAAMNGFIAPKDDPIWRTWWPPCDYSCRCTVIPVTDYYMQHNKKNFNHDIPDGAAVGEDFRRKAFGLDEYYALIRDRLKTT